MKTWKLLLLAVVTLFCSLHFSCAGSNVTVGVGVVGPYGPYGPWGPYGGGVWVGRPYPGYW
jgi:hypothetical protein